MSFWAGWLTVTVQGGKFNKLSMSERNFLFFMFRTTQSIVDPAQSI